MIPKILHQVWNSADIPEELRAYRESWRRCHPAWEYRFWTADSARHFVAERYPDFLPVYDGYPSRVERRDAFRYLLMHHHGGVYVDLDFECLRALDGLLADKQLVLGQEPTTHGAVFVPGKGYEPIVGNAFIASTPGHPFWAHLFSLQRERWGTPESFDATGRGLLSQAVSAYHAKDELTILDPDVIYPVDQEACWIAQGDRRRLVLPPAAVAVHHWFGTWWRPDVSDESAAGDEPLFSCLCVTERRPSFMPWLLWNFNKQSWANKELVVIDSSPEPTIESGDNVRVVRMAPGATVPEKRSRALAEARGHWIAWFDDDDWQHPERLRRLGSALGAGAQIASSEDTWMINLETGGCEPYFGEGELFFNALGLATTAARSSAFDLEPVVGSEPLWLRRVCRQFSHAVTLIPSSVLTTMLCHTTNLCNPSSRRRLSDPITSLVAEVGSQAWADTDDQLEALRDRLRRQPLEAPTMSTPVAHPAASPATVPRPLYRLY